MKNSTITLAILGSFAGFASAQSTVTLYGLVDATVIHTQGGSRVGGASVTELADGGTYGPGSRWGIRASEDLGSGLRANAVMESGFGSDTGASSQGNSNLGVASRLFGRQAFVSLASTTWGEFRLGRQYTFNDEVNVLNNPFSNNLLLYPGYYSSTGGTSPATRTNRLALFVDSPRIDNAAQYISPTFGGFRAQLMVAAGEGTPNNQPGAAVSVVPRYEAVKGSYVQGPLSAAMSYEQNRVSSIGTSNKVWTVAANYNFGPVKIMGGYQNAKHLTSYGMAYYGFPTNASLNIVPANAATAAFTLDSLKAATIGVAVPIGSMTLGANYIRVKYENAPGTLDATLGKFGIGALYSLSKTTSVYAAASMSTGDLKDSIQEKRVYQIGLRKVF